jgi:hypothetical protein
VRNYLCTAPLAFQLDDILKVRAKYRNFGRKTLDGLKIVFVSCALWFFKQRYPQGFGAD